ncbi:MAG TPA: hypothetical protein VHN18_15845, partial [Micromonosporaceae bacterium]|nr:hypothetical protein [Micromonosporaceae bacterium]
VLWAVLQRREQQHVEVTLERLRLPTHGLQPIAFISRYATVPTIGSKASYGLGVEMVEQLAIEARGLVKRFGDVPALGGVDLRLPVGGVL